MSSPSPLSLIPPSSWDSHMHVTSSNLTQYPISPTAQYTPTDHNLSTALSFESSITPSLSNIVLVQPSIYGTDNSLHLSALHTIGPSRGRAVLGFDYDGAGRPTIDTLKEWNSLGVRGVRVNFKSVGGNTTTAQLRTTLEGYASLLANAKLTNWVIQLYLSMAQVAMLEEVLLPSDNDAEHQPSVFLWNSKICIDHLGHPENLPAVSANASNLDPIAGIPNFDSLANLLAHPELKVYTKLSAGYRIEPDTFPETPWVRAMAKYILARAPERVVFATDWPHTRFDGVDVKPWIEHVVEWCGEVEAEGGKSCNGKLVEKVFRDNAELLWDVKRQ